VQVILIKRGRGKDIIENPQATL